MEMTPWELELMIEGRLDEDKRLRSEGALRALTVVRGFCAEKSIDLKDLFYFCMNEKTREDINDEIYQESRARVKAAEIEKMRSARGQG